MRVIDLLNKIANQKEIPIKVKWNYHIYTYDEHYDDYFEETTGLFQNEMSDGMLFKSLNDKVEIIEEDKEIEEIKIEQDSATHFYIRNEHGTKCGLTTHSRLIAEKLNEVIRRMR